jgi:tRNA (mo5U34)-methyltransferase
MRLPARLDGQNVLDIGAWDGFFSFECEKRGAQRVVSYDSVVWSMTKRGFTGKRGFELAKRTLRSQVEDIHGDVYELSPDRVGQFDIVLFMGVLYHLTHPILALERVRSVTRGFAIIETQAGMMNTSRPALAFYPGAELNNDDTNWFAPNIPALLGMLQAAGFSRAEVVYAPALWYRIARAAYWRMKHGAPFWRTISEGRAIVHAWP